jgi:ABC-type multidrug transport system ATPase subunit
MASIIQLKNITLNQGNKKVLDCIDLELREGQFVTIAGGPGKSALLRLLAGAEAADKGELRVLGGNPADPHFRARADIFYVHEDFQMTFPVSIREMMQIYRSVFSRWQNKYFTQMLQERGFSFEHQFTDLSWDQKNEILLILALAASPKLLCMDEAAVKLPVAAKNYYFNKMKKFTQNGGTVIVASNKLNYLKELSDHHLVMVEARLIDQGSLQHNEQELAELAAVAKSAA